jgi:hypothetical protein
VYNETRLARVQPNADDVRRGNWRIGNGWNTLAAVAVATRASASVVGDLIELYLEQALFTVALVGADDHPPMSCFAQSVLASM